MKLKAKNFIGLLGMIGLVVGILFFQNCSKVNFDNAREMNGFDSKGSTTDPIVNAMDEESELVNEVTESNEGEMIGDGSESGDGESNGTTSTIGGEDEQYEEGKPICNGPQHVEVAQAISAPKIYAQLSSGNGKPTTQGFEFFKVDEKTFGQIKRTGCANHIFVREEDLLKLDFADMKVVLVYPVKQ